MDKSGVILNGLKDHVRCPVRWLSRTRELGECGRMATSWQRAEARDNRMSVRLQAGVVRICLRHYIRSS